MLTWPSGTVSILQHIMIDHHWRYGTGIHTRATLTVMHHFCSQLMCLKLKLQKKCYGVGYDILNSVACSIVQMPSHKTPCCKSVHICESYQKLLLKNYDLRLDPVKSFVTISLMGYLGNAHSGTNILGNNTELYNCPFKKGHYCISKTASYPFYF